MIYCALQIQPADAYFKRDHFSVVNCRLTDQPPVFNCRLTDQTQAWRGTQLGAESAELTGSGMSVLTRQRVRRFLPRRVFLGVNTHSFSE